MRKGEIIQENLRYKAKLEHYMNKYEEALAKIDELSKEVSRLELYKARMEAGENQLWKTALDE